jgi:hypothetical protein
MAHPVIRWEIDRRDPKYSPISTGEGVGGAIMRSSSPRHLSLASGHSRCSRIPGATRSGCWRPRSNLTASRGD